MSTRNGTLLGRAGRLVLLASCLGLLGGLADSRVEGRASESVEIRSEDREHEIKAVFLLNFIRYATWPKTSFESAESPVRVLVVGRDPFGPALEATFRGEKALGRSIEVLRSLEVPDPPAAHVVFCGELAPEARAKLLAHSRGRPILLVGELEGLAQDGACINFYLQDQKTRFEINTDALAAASLELSPAVLKLARIVHSRKEPR